MDRDTDMAKLSSIFARISVGSILVAQYSHMTEPSGPLWLLFFVASMCFFLASVVLYFRSRSQATYRNVNPAPGFGGSYDFQDTRRHLQVQRSLHPSTYLGEGRDAVEWIRLVGNTTMVLAFIVLFVVVRVLPMSFEDKLPIVKCTAGISAIVCLLMAPCMLRRVFQARRLGEPPTASAWLSSVVSMLIMVAVGICLLIFAIYFPFESILPLHGGSDLV